MCLVAFPFIMAPLAGLIPNKRRDEMNQFFIRSIKKIIKQREEQSPDEVNVFISCYLLCLTVNIFTLKPKTFSFKAEFFHVFS